MTGPKLVEEFEPQWVQDELPFPEMDGVTPLRPAILNERESDYGDVRENHERIAALWSAYLGYPVTAHQVAMCMSLLKISRLKNTPTHSDSYEDLSGYLYIAETLAE